MDVHVSVAPETLWSIAIPGLGDLNITNSFLTMIIVMVALIVVGALIARSAKLIPGRAQAGFEYVVEFLLGLVEGTAGRRIGRRIFPLIGGLFIFIIVANYSGLLPGIGTVGFWREPEGGAAVEHAALVTDATTGEQALAAGEGAAEEEEFFPLFRSPNADLNMTLAMATLTFLIVQIAGIAAHGVGGRIRHLASPPFLFPIEVIQELSRIISLGFRLFGNIFAGEVLVTVMIAMANAIRFSIVGLAIPVVFLFLEVLFGFIQALVFALLTLIYIVLATASEEEGHIEEPAEAEPPRGAAPIAASTGSGD